VPLRPPRTVTILPTDPPGPSTVDHHIEVPLQQQYTGLSQVISSSLADIPCASFGIEGLLEQLNEVMRQSFTMEMPSIHELLDSSISRNYDFGFAYGRLRPWLNYFTPLSTLDRLEEEERKNRDAAIDHTRQRITKQAVPPRRVWDLYSNRVLPFALVRRDPWAISHSWMEEGLRQYVKTRINRYEWPVPIPVDTTLERVRIEMLNMGAVYVWLDVLCLRQEGPPGQESQEHRALRLEEWKVDVPTICHVYHHNRSVVSYFSGLGRPFRVGDLRSPRHWLNRAWTLQEVCEDAGTGGQTANSPVMAESGRYTDQDVMEFYDRLGSIRIIAQTRARDSIYPLLLNMKGRSASNEVDRVAGLAYVLGSGTLPIYLPGELLEEAWSRLLETMNDNFRGDLLFLYPIPGTGRCLWAPSWKQIVDHELPPTTGICLFETVTFLETCNAYRHKGLCVQKCSIRGLEQTNSDRDRSGNISVEANSGSVHTLAVFAYHQHPIPDRQDYVLICGQHPRYWIVGRWNKSDYFEKVSVLRMGDDSGTKLQELGHWKEIDYI
jgi:hypothetical protein